MAVYLAPGVYVEEYDSGPVPLAGGATSTAAFVGFTERIPTVDDKADGDLDFAPRPVTSWNQYKEFYGGFGNGDWTLGHRPLLPAAIFGFFNNGGSMAYIVPIQWKEERDPTKPELEQASTTYGEGEAPYYGQVTTTGVPSADDELVAALTVRTGVDAGEMAIAIESDHEKPDDPSKFGLRVRFDGREVVHIPSLSSGEVASAVATYLKDDDLPDDLITVVDGTGDPRTGTYALALPEPNPRHVSVVDVEGDLKERRGVESLKIHEDVSILVMPDLYNIARREALRLVDPREIGSDDDAKAAASAAIDAALKARRIATKAKNNVKVAKAARADAKAPRQAADRMRAVATAARLKADAARTKADTKPDDAANETEATKAEAAADGAEAAATIAEATAMIAEATAIIAEANAGTLNEDGKDGKAAADTLKTAAAAAADTAGKAAEADPTDKNKATAAAKAATAAAEAAAAADAAAADPGDEEKDPDQAEMAATVLEKTADKIMADYNKVASDWREVDLSTWKAVQTMMLVHCENETFRLAVLDPPPNKVRPDQVADWRTNDAMYDAQPAALYYPWIEVSDPVTDGKMFMPPSGHMTGVWARTDTNPGIWKAPANETVQGALGVQYKMTSAEQELLNPIGINAIRPFGTRGIRVWGARTLSSNANWNYISVRRLFSWIEKTIMDGTQWVVFEPNDQTTWDRVNRTVSNFLTGLWRDGALFGATPAAAFYVKCDAETNPTDSIDLGKLVCEVGIAPVKPAEFVIFRITQWKPQ